MLHNLESAFGIVHVDQGTGRHLLEGLFCKLLKRKFLMEVINCSWDSSWYCSWFQVKDGAVVKCVESWWMRGFCSQVSKHSLIGQCVAVMWRHLWDIFVEHLSRPWSNICQNLLEMVLLARGKVFSHRAFCVSSTAEWNEMWTHGHLHFPTVGPQSVHSDSSGP